MKRIISAAVAVCLVCMVLGAVSVGAEAGTMTRLEAVMFIEECVSSEIDESFAELNPFTDAPEGAEACLGFAYKNYIVKGVGDNLFVPEREVTREEFLLMALRLIGRDNVWSCGTYVSAYVAGIYDYTDNINESFTASEAETIMAKVFVLERYATGRYKEAEPSGNVAAKVEEEKAAMSEYRRAIGEYYDSSFETVKYINELSDKTILFTSLVGTPHGSSAIGCIIDKNDGTELMNLPLQSTFWVSLMPDEIWVSEDEKTLYYSTDIYEQELIPIEGKENYYNIKDVFSGTSYCEVNLETLEVIETFVEAE